MFYFLPSSKEILCVPLWFNLKFPVFQRLPDHKDPGRYKPFLYYHCTVTDISMFYDFLSCCFQMPQLGVRNSTELCGEGNIQQLGNAPTQRWLCPVFTWEGIIPRSTKRHLGVLVSKIFRQVEPCQRKWGLWDVAPTAAAVSLWLLCFGSTSPRGLAEGKYFS